MGETLDTMNTEPHEQSDARSISDDLAKEPVSGGLDLPHPALGPFGDIPVAYAIFQVDLDEATGKATDARYLYANHEYDRIVRRSSGAVIGRSHLEIGEIDAEEWLSQCYRAVVGGETINGFEYNPLARAWICFNLAPCTMPGCCTYAFITVGDQQSLEHMTTMEARTSRFVSEMLSALAGKQSYTAAMNGVLEMVSKVIQTDRLSIFECTGDETKITFERTAQGATSLLGTVFDLPRWVLGRWFRGVVKDPVALVPDIAILESFSKPLYDWCRINDVNSLMAAPFFNEGEMVGFLGAYNYQIDETIDLNRLFGAVSSFIGARIDNRRLIDKLAWASDHDSLTELLNRRGVEREMSRIHIERPDDPCALILLDLDDFKRINDVYGHAAGDEALKAMARTMRQTFPTSATLSRNGGDEFLAVLWGEDTIRVDDLVAKFEQTVIEYEFEGVSRRVTTSIGYASYPEQADKLSSLYDKADTALYAVKLAGKAGFGKYDPETALHYREQLGFTARDILDNVPYAIIVHKADSNNAILFASMELTRLLGCESMHDLMRFSNGSLAGIVQADDRNRVLASLNRQIACKAESGLYYDFDLVTKAGATATVHAISQLVDIAEVGTAFYTLLVPAESSE